VCPIDITSSRFSWTSSMAFSKVSIPGNADQRSTWNFATWNYTKHSSRFVSYASCSFPRFSFISCHLVPNILRINLFTTYPLIAEEYHQQLWVYTCWSCTENPFTISTAKFSR
jgi:hypothetical protein